MDKRLDLIQFACVCGETMETAIRGARVWCYCGREMTARNRVVETDTEGPMSQG